MAKNCFYFIFEGLSDTGAKIGPSPISGCGETKTEAKKDATEKFKTSKHAVKVTCCDPK